MKTIVPLLIAISSLLHGYCLAGPFGRVFAEDGEKRPSGEPLPLSIDLGDRPAASSQQYQTTTYVADWCGPCHSMQNKNGNGDSRIVCEYVTSAPPRGVPESYPTTTWTDASGTLRYVSGVKTLDQLVAAIERNNPPTPTVGSRQPAASAGVIHGRDRIIAALDFIRSRVGEGVPMRFEWGRTGAQSLPLLRGGEWTPLAIYGKSGEFRMSAAGAVNLPVNDVSLGYRIVDGKLRLRGETEIDAGVLDWSKPATASSSKAVGVDPMTVLTVISVLNGIWQMLHPTADITLGGNVSCEAVLNDGVLSIKFTQAPNIRIVAWFTFNLGVESVDISADRVRVGFSGSRWIKERTFEVTQ